ncbi:MAG: ABC transporter permease, partial [Halobacteria archaeon]|nr:ABC transporter permease [Halobacteria archaeon]
FVTPEMLPEFFETAVALLPLTYFSRGVRAATFTRQDPTFELVVLTGVALVCFVAGVYSVPWKE